MNLLITGAFNWKEEQIKALSECGYKIFYIEKEDADLCLDVSMIDAVVCNYLFVHHDIGLFKNLKIVQLLSAGLDRIPIDYVNEHNIKVYNARGVYSIPMAEFAICGVLQLYKKSHFFARNQKHHHWEKNRELEELTDKTVCIIGTGSIGVEVAKRFNAFTENVIGVDLNPQSNALFKKIYPIDQLNNVISTSDIVILTLPLNNNTYGMFDETRFSYFKKKSILVNISRGGLVSEKALLKELDTNIAGAVLDVFEEEPMNKENPLWDRDNVIITPHNSFVSNKNNERMWKLILENMKHIEIE
ncbi:MAG: NAD(P)-dependent oxidoreductase [Clostridiaceae bacterium]